jgi:hypothetical protein
MPVVTRAQKRRVAKLHFRLEVLPILTITEICGYCDALDVAHLSRCSTTLRATAQPVLTAWEARWEAWKAMARGPFNAARYGARTDMIDASLCRLVLSSLQAVTVRQCLVAERKWIFGRCEQLGLAAKRGRMLDHVCDMTISKPPQWAWEEEAVVVVPVWYCDDCAQRLSRDEVYTLCRGCNEERRYAYAIERSWW